MFMFYGQVKDNTERSGLLPAYGKVEPEESDEELEAIFWSIPNPYAPGHWTTFSNLPHPRQLMLLFLPSDTPLFIDCQLPMHLQLLLDPPWVRPGSPAMCSHSTLYFPIMDLTTVYLAVHLFIPPPPYLLWQSRWSCPGCVRYRWRKLVPVDNL